MWLTLLAGLAFGVVDVLVPLRLAQLGATTLIIGGTFLAAAAIESALSPLAGRLSDRRGALVPIQISLCAAVLVSLLVPVLAPAAALIALLVVGMPSYGTLFTPASALLSNGAHRLNLNQGLAFGLANLAWAGGQTVGAAVSGALAQATSDLVPFALLAAVCLGTLVVLRALGPASASPGPVSWRSGQRVLVLAVEQGGQPGRGDDPVRVLAQLGDLGPVHVAVEPDADPPTAAHVRRPEEPAGLGRHELVLGPGQARAPQMRKVIRVVAPRPQRHKRLLVPDEPGRRAVAGPLGDLRQREADRPEFPGQIGGHRVSWSRSATTAK